MIKQSCSRFIIDSLLRRFEDKESVYAHPSAVDAYSSEIEDLAEENGGSPETRLLMDLHDSIRANLLKAVRVTHGNAVAAATDAEFHSKFGWVISSDLGKAFLGKLSIPPGVVLSIGFMTYFSGFSRIIGDAASQEDPNLEIGSFCSIASDALIITKEYSHPTCYPSTFNFFGNARVVAEGMEVPVSSFSLRGKNRSGVHLGNDCWLGMDVTIMNGVTLGDGCVVGAKALVTADCLPFGIYGGVPAKLIRFRFDQDVRRQLLCLKWWNWSYERIRANARFFDTDLTQYRGPITDLIH